MFNITVNDDYLLGSTTDNPVYTQYIEFIEMAPIVTRKPAHWDPISINVFQDSIDWVTNQLEKQRSQQPSEYKFDFEAKKDIESFSCNGCIITSFDYDTNIATVWFDHCVQGINDPGDKDEN